MSMRQAFWIAMAMAFASGLLLGFVAVMWFDALVTAMVVAGGLFVAYEAANGMQVAFDWGKLRLGRLWGRAKARATGQVDADGVVAA
jgi:hypothetical protein